VTDGSRLLNGFHKEDFQISDNGSPQTILYFSAEETPLDLILLFDISAACSRSWTNWPPPRMPRSGNCGAEIASGDGV